MRYQKLILFGIFLIVFLLPLYFAYDYFGKVIQTTGVKNPNVILVTLDTCQYGAVAAYGNPDVYTPFMNNLSRNGVLFQRGYAPIPTTGPSHTTILTGRSPITHRVFRNGMKYNGQYVTIGKLMQDAGYKTAAFVSGYSVTAGSCGLDAGFDFYDDSWAETQLERDGSETVNSCLKWIDENKNNPFFIWLHLFDPHSPYQEREPWITSIRNTLNADVETVEQRYTDEQKEKYKKNVDNALNKGDFMVLVKHPMARETTPETFRKHWSAYLSEISYTDKWLGSIRSALSERGLWTRTMMLLTADHGEGFDHDYFFAHGDRLWESAVRVPWIIRFPLDLNKDLISKAIARHEDIFPTIQSTCHINFPIPGIEGYDLKSTSALNLAGQTSAWVTIAPPLPRKQISDGLVISAYDPHFKLIKTKSKDTEKLFLLKNDPAELNDVSTDYPRIKARLSKYLDYTLKKGRIPEVTEFTENESNQTQQLKALGYIQ